MYLGETELERQMRETESAQTDSILAQLFPKAQPLPELTVQASPLPFLAVIVGLWWLMGKKGGRMLWLLLLLYVTPLAAQIPAGLSGWINMDDWCSGKFTLAQSSFAPDRLLRALAKAKQCNVKLVWTYPRRLYTVNGENNGRYDPKKHRALSDAYAKVLVPDTVKKYANWNLGGITGDDFGCAACWGGVAIPISEARDAGNYAKKKMPKVPIGIRLDAVRMATVNGWLIDFGVAQWVRSKYYLRVYGNQSKWFTLNAIAAAKIGVRMFYMFNTSDCYGATPHTQCPSSIVKEQGTIALAQAKNCGFFPWHNDDATYNGTYKAAYVNLFSFAKTQPFTSCLVR